MSKNTASSKFRNVDVDEYDEEKYTEDATDDASVKGINESEINSFLSMKKNSEALKCALSSAPLGCKDKLVKDRAMSLMIRVLTSFKQSEIEAAVKSLAIGDLDVLMKYIYRGFAEPVDNSSALLLVWHEKVLASAGLGCIVRVLTDRKRV